MAIIPFLALVRKDLQLFFSDRRAVIVAFAVPIAIGAFIGSITDASSPNAAPPRVKIAIADEDGSVISKAVVAGAQADDSLVVAVTTADEAKSRVRKGTTSVAVVLPKDFGEQAARSMFRSETKPELSVFFDPSRTIEVGLVRGILTQHVMGGGAFALPFTVHQEAMTSRSNVPYNGYAHAFAGMGIQFLLFSALNLRIEMLVERQRGLWARLRSAPRSPVR